ncbi:transposon TX1 uncharacterized 149 kDa protein [Trichonephila clavipes]|uniref:Transposon TX1 uncharacterized 149 kDa protein n=1 Tax=Trichonephila clavipes TaxID=2585209 RepID=A0A8X6VHD4_TRICX|nr:transposon TX1 uncharacterized 149 kDa protein [Trichonephila clavipes]
MSLGFVYRFWKLYMPMRRDEPTVLQNVHTEQDIIADEENPPPSVTEVTLVIKQLKNNRSTGLDSIPSELLKVDEPELVNALHKIMVKIWETEKIPIEWEEGSVCPIFKKGDQLECRNYREITLLNTAYKIFSNLLFARLQSYTDKLIGSYQWGFRPQRSTIDQIHTLRQILEKTKEYNIKTFHLFVDFKAAYDSINRDKIIEAMTEFKISKKIVNFSKATLKNVRCRIKIQKFLSEPFTIERGMHQGDKLACLPLNLKQLRSKFISGKTKLRLYKTLILPVLLYASETWTLNLETIRALETFERKALRTIFGPFKDQGCWHTRHNFQLYKLYKEPQVTPVIRSNRLRWLGHIWRSPENNRTRAYTVKVPMGSRTRGRPPTRWIYR